MRRPFTSASLWRMTMTSGSLSIMSLIEVSHWLSLSDELCLLSAYQRSAEINEQLSRRNTLSALCYQSNYVNCFPPHN